VVDCKKYATPEKLMNLIKHCHENMQAGISVRCVGDNSAHVMVSILMDCDKDVF